MSSFKRIKGDYTIQSVSTADNVVVNTNTFKVNGNLDVVGNLSYINVQELNIRDPFIMLNSSNTATYSANSGIVTHKTAASFAGLRWSNAAAQWQVSGDTDPAGEAGTWLPLATGNATVGGANTQIQFNNSGTFGAAANLTFDKDTNQLTLQGHQVIGNIGSAPAATANAVTVYHTAAAAGDSGLYVTSTEQSVELVSKKRAILFGIIF